MGKKGSWFAALKGAFTISSKDKEIEKKHATEKRNRGMPAKLRHGKEIASIIPRTREPSTVEKILGDAEEEQHRRISDVYPRNREKEPLEKKEQELASDFQRQQKVTQEPKRDHNDQHQHQKIIQVPLNYSEREKQQKIHELSWRINEREPNQMRTQAPPKRDPQLKVPRAKARITQEYMQSSAIKIQAAYRGYMERKNFRALKGLMRLQQVMKGMSIKRQTMNTMRSMQLLVKVQYQVRSMRLRRMETRKIPRNDDNQGKYDKETQSRDGKLGSFTQSQLEAEARERWNDSVLAKEDIDERMKRKMEAISRRERAFAYAYSNQLSKATPQSAYFVLSHLKPEGVPTWSNWLDQQPPPAPPTPPPQSETTRRPTLTPKIPKNPPPFIAATPLRFIGRSRPPPSTPTIKPKPPGNSSNRWRAPPTPGPRDDESLTSCPAYGLPSYMAPTVSAVAKVREAAPPPEARQRFSFGLGQSIGSLKWGWAGPSRVEKKPDQSRGKHRSTHSIGELSVDSAVSLPVGVGKRAFRL